MSWTREDKRTYKCCPCCSDAPDDHPGGIRDWHTIHCGTYGCIEGKKLTPLEPS